MRNKKITILVFKSQDLMLVYIVDRSSYWRRYWGWWGCTACTRRGWWRGQRRCLVSSDWGLPWPGLDPAQNVEPHERTDWNKCHPQPGFDEQKVDSLIKIFANKVFSKIFSSNSLCMGSRSNSPSEMFWHLSPETPGTSPVPCSPPGPPYRWRRPPHIRG